MQGAVFEIFIGCFVSGQCLLGLVLLSMKKKIKKLKRTGMKMGTSISNGYNKHVFLSVPNEYCKK